MQRQCTRMSVSMLMLLSCRDQVIIVWQKIIINFLHGVIFLRGGRAQIS